MISYHARVITGIRFISFSEAQHIAADVVVTTNRIGGVKQCSFAGSGYDR